MRFLAAGFILFGWLLIRRETLPTPREWLSISLLALLIFMVDYGCLFWAEQRVPSGLAAVMMATIPVFTALTEITFLRTQRLTLRLSLALVVGIIGVAILVSHTLNLGDAPIDTPGAIACIIGSIAWSIASVLSRKLPLPPSKVMSAAAQMLIGGLMLTLAAGSVGDFRSFHPAAISTAAWVALAYLIVAGSLIGFTAYVWLIHHESPTKVGTYAYVNPVVAVLLGYFAGHEALGPRTLLGTLSVLISVILITTTRKPAAA